MKQDRLRDMAEIARLQQELRTVKLRLRSRPVRRVPCLPGGGSGVATEDRGGRMTVPMRPMMMWEYAAYEEAGDDPHDAKNASGSGGATEQTPRGGAENDKLQAMLDDEAVVPTAIVTIAGWTADSC